MVQMFRFGGFLLHSSVPFKHTSIIETDKTIHVTVQPSTDDNLDSIETCINTRTCTCSCTCILPKNN